jgi:cytochrome P450
VVGLLMGYIVAAFDTTINAISSAAVLLARHPEQWQALRAKPDLASNAFNEVIRLESPIQYFTRVTTREVQLDDVVIPKHARVLISYGAANRDERRFDRADEFDITRPVINHLAFSTGKHNCAGQNLARLEGQAILRALATGVSSLELIGEPQLALNNAGRGYGRVPMKFRA